MNIYVTQPNYPVLHRDDLGSGFVMPCINLLHGSSFSETRSSGIEHRDPSQFQNCLQQWCIRRTKYEYRYILNDAYKN